MSITMSAASVPLFVRQLTNLAAILDKAEIHAEERKIDPGVLISARLFPDMLPLRQQVQIACDTAKGAVARLAGIPVPKHEDTEMTFPELQTRIKSTLDFIATVAPAKIDGSEERQVTLKLRGNDVPFTGMQYLVGFALPNFFFHVTTAYNILRHNGVPLGKRDYLGNP